MCGGQKNKKPWVGISVGFLVNIFILSVLLQWFSFKFISVVPVFLHLAVTLRRLDLAGNYL